MDLNAALPRLREVLAALGAGTSIDGVLQLVLDQACGLVGARHGSLMRIDREAGVLVIQGTVGDDWTPEKRAARIAVGDGVTGTVARTGEPYLCPDTAADPRYIALFPNIRAEVAVPVVLNQATWAVINMDAETPGAFGPDQVELLAAYAELVSFAIEAAIAQEKVGVTNLEALLQKMGTRKFSA